METLLQVLLLCSCLFLVLLILVQRGRGGGLAGAFGGMGGQSAFGTKAGDTFTRITIIAAVVWILLCIGAIRWMNSSHSAFGGAGAAPTSTAPDTAKGSAPADNGDAPSPPTDTPADDGDK